MSDDQIVAEAIAKNREVLGVFPANGAVALVVETESALYVREHKVLVGFVAIKESDGEIVVHPLGVKGTIEVDENVETIFIMHANGTVEGHDPEGCGANSFLSLAAFEDHLEEAMERWKERVAMEAAEEALNGVAKAEAKAKAKAKAKAEAEHLKLVTEEDS